MTVRELSEKLECKILVEGAGLENLVEGGYCGDLLSWVMGRANAGDAWITVMGNVNAVAVAVLADVCCIILSENAPLDDDAKKRADMQGITILGSGKNTYELAKNLSILLG